MACRRAVVTNSRNTLVDGSNAKNSVLLPHKRNIFFTLNSHNMQSHEGVQYLVISLLIIFKATSKDDGIAMSVAYALFTHFSAY